MAEFVKVAKISEVPPGTRKLVDFEEVTVAYSTSMVILLYRGRLYSRWRPGG